MNGWILTAHDRQIGALITLADENQAARPNYASLRLTWNASGKHI
jgi:hypothetical protein